MKKKAGSETAGKHPISQAGPSPRRRATETDAKTSPSRGILLFPVLRATQAQLSAHWVKLLSRLYGR